MMMTIKTLLANPVLVSLMIAGGSVFFLLFAFTAEYGFGLQPCDLCLYQRIPYVVTALLGGVGLFLASKYPQKTAFFVFIAALVFLGEAGLAFYHVGVEQHWWVSFLEGCKVSFDGGPQDLLATIEKSEAVRCDEVPWQMFGLSMAGYNLIAALSMAVGSVLASICIMRKINGVL